MPLNRAQLNDIFSYHKPTGTQPERYAKLREKAKDLAQLIDDCCPESREKSLAITSLQQTTMWANASIAINENKAETGQIAG